MNLTSTQTNDILHQAFAENFCLYYSSHVAHVNTQGRNFYSDHAILKDIYEDAQTMIDVYAEYLRTRREYMCNNLTELQDNSTIMCGFAGVMSADDYLESMYDRIEVMIDTLGDLYRAAEADGDYGLSGFVQERLTTHKKQCWQLRSILNEDTEEEEDEDY